MVAFALRADGWYLRQDIIWAKPNPMPESVRDRCTKAHEYLFLLSKGQRYYWDATAIAESSVIGAGAVRNITPGIKGQASMRNDDDRFGVVNDGTRNKRSVWSIPTAPFPEAHFATFPPDLVRPCVLAGAPEGGTVLDPFVGSGTTAMVAKQLGRKAVGIDLNPEYLAMAVGRMTAVTLPFSFAQPPCEIVAEPGAVVTGQCK
jgi:DNA modification methylase